MRRHHHHASPPKRRRDQHRHRHSVAATRSPPRAGQLDPPVVGPSALRHGTVTKPVSQGSDCYSAVPRETIPSAPSPPSALLPHGLFATRQMLPFGLDNTTTSLTKTVHPSTNAHVERPLALTRSVTARQEVPLLAASPGFPEIRRPRPLRPGRYTLPC